MTPRPLSEWFSVRFDEERASLHAEPPGGEPWEVSFRFDEVERVCFEAGEYLSPDTVYVFVSGREASYRFPTEAKGGVELWGEMVRRELFDAELAIRVATMGEGIACWPPVEGQVP